MNEQGAVSMNKPGTLQEIIKAFDRAMRIEGVPDDKRRRVINTLVWGSPEGAGL